MNLCTGTRCSIARLGHAVAIARTGYPSRFSATLRMYGVQPEKYVSLVDRQSLSRADVSILVSAGQTPAMTERDATKCRAFVKEDWRYLPVNAQLSGDEPVKLSAQPTSLAFGHQLRCGSVRLMES